MGQLDYAPFGGLFLSKVEQPLVTQGLLDDQLVASDIPLKSSKYLQPVLDVSRYLKGLFRVEKTHGTASDWDFAPALPSLS